MKLRVGALKRASKAWLKRGLSRAARAGAAPRAIPAAHFGLHPDASGTLALGGVGLTGLLEQFGSPLHVVDAARLRRNARDFVEQPFGRSQRCAVFSSYKTNPVPGVLAELHAAGIGAEVISHYELWLALQMGVPPRKIIYNGPGKSEASLELAVTSGIELININHREEVDVLARIARKAGRKPRVGLRATLDGWAGQFGIPVAGGDALRAFEHAQRSDALDLVALHVHRGGMLSAASELARFLDGALAFADELRDRLGLRLEILDLGGSLASRSVRPLSAREQRLNMTLGRELEAPDPMASLSIGQYVSRLLERVEAHYRARGEQPPRVWLEPGRALTSDAQFLLTRVMSVKHGAERSHAILDAGINLAESCRAEYHQVLPVSRYGAPAEHSYTLVGPICSPGDTLRWAATLPILSPGDALAIMDAGAYFVPFSTSFSFPRPAIVMVDDGQVRLLRRAETFEDLIAFDAKTTVPPAAFASGAGT
jgi:diaminopimelate decarboxylase